VSPQPLSHALSRRQLLMAAAAGVATVTFESVNVSCASALEATPSAAFANLGLPTLDVHVTAHGYQGIPGSMSAGRYLVTVTADADVGDEGVGVGFVQPAGMSGQDFVNLVAQLGGQSAASGPAGAVSSPVAGVEASPAAAEQGVPPFFYKSRLAGGISVSAGALAQVVVDLTPGDWVAWGDDPGGAQKPVPFQATGDMPANLPEPTSGATLTLGEYVIKATKGELKAGSQIIRIDNVGAQPHFVICFKAPANLTEDDVKAVLEAEMTGTPAAVAFNPDKDLQPAFGTSTQSTGTSSWIVGNLTAGTYLLACFFPDEADGQPHANHGMFAIVKVS